MSIRQSYASKSKGHKKICHNEDTLSLLRDLNLSLFDNCCTLAPSSEGAAYVFLPTEGGAGIMATASCGKERFFEKSAKYSKKACLMSLYVV